MEVGVLELGHDDYHSPTYKIFPLLHSLPQLVIATVLTDPVPKGIILGKLSSPSILQAHKGHCLCQNLVVMKFRLWSPPQFHVSQ